jgi:hypothetical protein
MFKAFFDEVARAAPLVMLGILLAAVAEVIGRAAGGL